MSKTIKFMSRIPEYAWLSNFALCSVTDLHGIAWKSAEHCYQAAKTTLDSVKGEVFHAPNAISAKRIGSTIKLRSDWEDIKVETMRRILVAKFTQNPEFYTLLLDTKGVALVHESPWDGFWGNGKTGHGTNILGKLLTDMRDNWLENEPARPVSIQQEPNAEYIGRAGKGMDGYFGNPYRVGSECERCGEYHMNGGSTLPCYARYFWDRIKNDSDFKESVLLLKGRQLGCFCKTSNGIGDHPCHGDIISLWLNNYGTVVSKET